MLCPFQPANISRTESKTKRASLHTCKMLQSIHEKGIEVEASNQKPVTEVIYILDAPGRVQDRTGRQACEFMAGRLPRNAGLGITFLVLKGREEQTKPARPVYPSVEQPQKNPLCKTGPLSPTAAPHFSPHHARIRRSST
jgi:hypothetical protein